MKIDTLRLLLFWECNLSCDYCCNDIPEVRASIKQISAENIEAKKYENICISGGEPFINPDIVLSVAEAFHDKDVFIYSNGLLLTDELLDYIIINHLKLPNNEEPWPGNWTCLVLDITNTTLTIH